MGDGVDISALIDGLTDRWGTWQALALMLALAGCACLWLFSLRLTVWDGAATATVLGTVAVVWWATRFQRTPRGKVGFGLAIRYDGAHGGGLEVQEDFSGVLRRLINGSPAMERSFHFFEFRRPMARRISEASPEEVKRLVLRARAHFVLDGRVRARAVGGEDSYVLELRGTVLHRQLPDALKQAFAADFSGVLPPVLLVPRSDSLPGFEVAARHVDVVARYIIGSAAAFSGQLRYAEELLLDARRRCAAGGAYAVPAGDPLPKRVTARLVELYLAQAGAAYRRWLGAPSAADAAAVRTACANLDLVEPGFTYGKSLLKAICSVVIDGDTRTARAELERCRRVKDAAWCYGIAFLDAAEGNLEGAYRGYVRAFGLPTPDASVSIQCEQFIQWFLSTRPSAVGLYFCLGLINYRAKGDLVAARADLGRFLALTAGCVAFREQREAAERWIAEIADRIGERGG